VPYKELSGNLFNSSADALVNTVNCAGAMGKGIALEYRRRFPAMFEKYQVLCEQKKLKPGQIWPYMNSKPIVLNFAIKNDWHFPTRVEWIEECLAKFVADRQRLGVSSVAFPRIGAMNGGVPLDTIKSLMRHHLSNIPDLDVEVYDFDPDAPDPLYRSLQSLVTTLSPKEFSKAGRFSKKTVSVIYSTMETQPPSLYRLIEAASLGTSTADKLYSLLLEPPSDEISYNLFTQL
jgi:O-acetyl-ADP-ribose deacetylase (regulator of RNase III)